MVKKTINGINVEKLAEIISKIKEDPELAKFTFRTNTDWLKGGHSITSIQGFYGFGKEDLSRDEPFEVLGDEPKTLLGTNQGPGALEILLHSLASCLAVGVIYNAAAQGITIDTLEIDLEGDIDLQGFLGLSETIRPGYNLIRANCTIESDSSKEKLEELFNHVQKTSPVLDILKNPVNVTINLDYKQ